MREVLPWLNVIILPIIYYLIRIEHRLTKIETLMKVNCNHKD